ncbi:hypothetical protein PYCCODRAFT_1113760 [Trametes coccinea BRFM310]|uniref:Uncharacterized protein n=1 Tax=Trametes coccinea (strain BRFM310) TaxID=1353009 RepID=A0A1Y2I9F0_TRAC3|nr:hypothetical protein PYCCODRAFT_1113760 [Trametes coccinea BRFM310]
MNSFWDLVDWLLPPVRIVDDLADPADSVYRSRSNNHNSHVHHSHHRHSSPQVTRRTSTRDFDKERERERERRKSSRALEYEREREQYRLRVQHLERENEALREQLKTTREELANLTTAVFPPTPERTMPPSPLTPQDSSQPPALASTSTHLQVTPMSRQGSISSNSAEAALSDPKRLRVLYTALRASYSDARQTILSQAEELASLKSFLSKTDDWSGAQLLQALADLNSEIIQLAASVSEEFSPALRAHEYAPSAAKERDREVVERALGPEMIRLLEDRMHAGDPTLVQFALQAWEVWCVARVLEAFCYGLPMEVDEAFRMIFEHMHREEPQPTTSRWRALTYKHAHTLLAQRRSTSSSPPSPDSPVQASPFTSAPASLASSSTLPPPLLTLTERNLRGVIAILALSGCTDPRGLHRDPLRTRFGSALSRISARAERISNVIKTGVMSGLFEAVWVPPCRPVPKTHSRRSSVAEPSANVVNGATRSKGKEREREREWVKEVERERRASKYDAEGDDDRPPADAPKRAADERWFDCETMENVYAGYGSEHCRVLCTVELGLAFRRRLPEREEESVDGDGMPASRPTSSASKGPPGVGGNAGRVGAGEVEVEVEDGDVEGEVTASRMEWTLLLKPKVLLESVTEIL